MRVRFMGEAYPSISVVGITTTVPASHASQPVSIGDSDDPSIERPTKLRG